MMYEFIDCLVRKTFPSESPIIGVIIHSAIMNLTDHIKLIVTIKLRLDFAKYPVYNNRQLSICNPCCTLKMTSCFDLSCSHCIEIVDGPGVHKV
ncbi:hypothetical protein ALC53_10728 [Atta colombica]|uniref:APO domain-containing protein n=1 Tax=Atta colombica TaxID=520822 RepID=A0A151HZX8_9HYME|nr:hypothetical protein ALC53_10728 [Atta colombica]